MADWSDESIRQAARDIANDKIWVSTTLAIIQSIRVQRYDLQNALAGSPEIKYVDPGILKEMWVPGANTYEAYPDSPREEVLERISGYIDAMERMFVALHEEGAFLLSGTDSNVPLMVPGFSLHDELAAMVDLGMSSYDALRTSTYNPARYLGRLDEFGTVGPGKRADLVLLGENPLEEISNTKMIDGVMVRRRWYSRADLDAVLEAIAAANRQK